MDTKKEEHVFDFTTEDRNSVVANFLYLVLGIDENVNRLNIPNTNKYSINIEVNGVKLDAKACIEALHHRVESYGKHCADNAVNEFFEGSEIKYRVNEGIDQVVNKLNDLALYLTIEYNNRKKR